jgi:hypothetical protein
LVIGDWGDAVGDVVVGEGVGEVVVGEAVGEVVGDEVVGDEVPAHSASIASTAV